MALGKLLLASGVFCQSLVFLGLQTHHSGHMTSSPCEFAVSSFCSCLSLPKCPFLIRNPVILVEGPSWPHFHSITSVKTVLQEKIMFYTTGVRMLAHISRRQVNLSSPPCSSEADVCFCCFLIPLPLNSDCKSLFHPWCPALPHTLCTLGAPLSGLCPCLPGVMVLVSPSRGVAGR